MGAHWRFTAMAVRVISELRAPVLTAMMEMMEWTVFVVSIFVLSLLPLPILSFKDRSSAKAMVMVEEMVLIWKGEGKNKLRRHL